MKVTEMFWKGHWKKLHIIVIINKIPFGFMSENVFILKRSQEAYHTK